MKTCNTLILGDHLFNFRLYTPIHRKQVIPPCQFILIPEIPELWQLKRSITAARITDTFLPSSQILISSCLKSILIFKVQVKCHFPREVFLNISQGSLSMYHPQCFEDISVIAFITVSLSTID